MDMVNCASQWWILPYISSLVFTTNGDDNPWMAMDGLGGLLSIDIREL